MARVYLETSFISACVTTRTDPASLYRRETSREWWDTQRSRHELFISAEVIAELSDPRYPTSSDALNWVGGLPLLAIDQDVLGLATIFIRERVLPSPIEGDATHVAAACVGNMEFLLSWNVRHLANPNKVRHLQTVCLRAGLVPPQIVTPDLLWESDYETSN